jgi:hypothetical protein
MVCFGRIEQQESKRELHTLVARGRALLLEPLEKRVRQARVRFNTSVRHTDDGQMSCTHDVVFVPFLHVHRIKKKNFDIPSSKWGLEHGQHTHLLGNTK